MLDLLLKNLAADNNQPFIIWKDKKFSKGWLLSKIDEYSEIIKTRNINSGEIVQLIADYSPFSIAIFIALALNKNIVFPVLPSSKEISHYFELSKANFAVKVEDENLEFEEVRRKTDHPLINKLQNSDKPGLILATSGTTGEPKLILHNFDKFLAKYKNARKKYVTLAFLLFDHIAGIDTLFYSLYSGGTLVVSELRQPAYICSLIEKHRIEVLPASPSFLNLLLLSEEYNNYDLTSLKIITFGSEPMPEIVLKKLKGIFKDIKIIQKYGVSELGSPISKSKEDDPQWIKFKSDHFKIKIVDSELWIKSDSAMMGYLNARYQFADEGWFNTGDNVLVDESGEYIKILGRNSDIINIGGEKVFPTEIENVLLQMEEIEDAIISSEPHLILGNMIIARIKPKKEEYSKTELIKKIKKYCRERLDPFKIPQKFIFATGDLFGNRIKKERKV